MSLKSWWSARRKRRLINASQQENRESPPLREFVYLDEVSLHSLLVSQKSTILDNVSEAISRADEAEVGGTLGASTLGVKAELNSRYQTSNSNSTQSSRKAIVQTLFKEFRDLALEFNLSHTGVDPEPLEGLDEVSKLAVSSLDLRRGALVEVEVELAVAPVFKLGSMMAEWKGMARDYPGMFGSGGLLGVLRETEPIMRVLDRFLAELVPIKAKAVHHVVIELDGVEHIVDKRAISKLNLTAKALYVVGVTEKIGYWKDLRRVLFSNARFTILCRIGRDGLNTSWTPVKLADLFADVAPDFVDQINAIEAPTAQSSPGDDDPAGKVMRHALTKYLDAVIAELGLTATNGGRSDLAILVNELAEEHATATSQNRAFDKLRDAVLLEEGSGRIDPDWDLTARQTARQEAGLPMFPSLASETTTADATPHTDDVQAEERLLDVEVIGIYW